MNSTKEKGAKVPHRKYLQRLFNRNEFYISSKHPLAETIINQTGKTKAIRRNFLEIETSSAPNMPPQYYSHFTPVFGLNYNRYLFSYHYTSNLGTLNLGASGLHYFSIGISFFVTAP